MANRLQLRGDTIEGLRKLVLDDHGPDARIVAAEQVTQGGIRGFLAKRYFEVTVEVPDETAVPHALVPSAPSAPSAHSAHIGIAALLADADDAEDLFAVRQSEGRSAGSNEFDRIINELTATLGEETPEATIVDVPPQLLSAPGDLVLVISNSQDALRVAHAMSRHLGAAEVRGGGCIRTRGDDELTDRRTALLARADGVGKGRVIICAFGTEPGVDYRETLIASNPDQVWVVVDASRKPEDTKRFVDGIADIVPVHAVAAVNVAYTASPDTINRLGIPIGWIDLVTVDLCPTVSDTFVCSA